MPKTNFYRNTLFIIGFLVIIAVATVYLQIYKKQTISQVKAFASISAPAGWKTVGRSYDQIIFSKDDLRLANGDPAEVYASWGTIHVDAQKMNTSMEDWLSGSHLYDSFSPAQTWNVINNHLILSSIEPEDVYNSLSYSIFDRDTVYTFSLGPYGTQPASVKNNPINTGDIEVLRNMVSDFGKSF